MICTDKSLSEALILASTNPQYENRLFNELCTSSIHENCKFRTWGEHVVYRNCFRHSEQFMYTTFSPHVLQKYIRASDKDLLVIIVSYLDRTSFQLVRIVMTAVPN